MFLEMKLRIQSQYKFQCMSLKLIIAGLVICVLSLLVGFVLGLVFSSPPVDLEGHYDDMR